MTINFKPGQHPDADQLSAFVEQALPAHEREGVLAHLAVCGECRGVVAFALPVEPALQPAPPAPAPRRWFTGWMVLLPASAAVAALAVFIAYVHHQTPAPQQQAQNTPAPQVQTAPPPQPQVVRQVPAAPITPSDKREKEPAPKPRQDISHAVVGNIAGASQGVAQALQMPSNQSQPPEANAANSLAPSERLRSANRPGPLQQNSNLQNVIHGELQSTTPNQVATQNENKLQAPRVNNQNAAQQENSQNSYQAATQTVQIQSEAAPLKTKSVEPNEEISSSRVESITIGGNQGGLLGNMPSGREVLSTVVAGQIVLAIDTHHKVFVSSDAGGHWLQVRAVWKGQAVRVETVSDSRSLSLRGKYSGSFSIAALQPGAGAAKITGATLTGTVTDASGAVVPGAGIVVSQPAIGLSRNITTDANGRFTASGLEAGNYNLVATASGFETSRLTNVAVSAANENVANVTLNVGAAAETVTVDAGAQDLKAPPVAKVKKAQRAAAPASPPAAPVFEMVTDKGARWASPDGITWRPE